MQTTIDSTFKSILTTMLVTKVYGMKYFYAEKLDKIRDKLYEVLLQIVNDRLNTRKNEEKTTYIDYTHEMVMNGEITQDEEIGDLLVLFGAGTDTTSSSLEFGITLLAKYPDIQEKVRKELLDIMGKEYDMKLVNKCPLFRAAVHEILRISSVAFFGLARMSEQDYYLTMDDGTKYKIPKRTLIQTNLV